ncbi:dTDP-glucose 4,6-dehydratase [Halalkalibacterium halodurans]|uniref:dTDP-glucose 4,6-dehydratase n=1 Tax=Halalkalibacterium halodurans (strain ATCC BAA-125 / DSM 18197 / FERM 7344 / JCM 9153 / C-125) TaxID=272558 RepID=Q9K7J7_HALH5|nr:dTDP-glucose 4,6-dehydratase [Halalkalibacterium halodurans]MED4172740.1 dTDP-glucose 4,6-dehydratase [Halalkalibacterium halodurans]BAB07083.1 spore coat polysaccharide synthesis (dTDP glucose 4, 6-dehydratase) [Halalkalibacterium halodurans C-125]
MSKQILVTGGAGFIGSHFIEALLQHKPTYHITNVDVLTYAGKIENMSGFTKHPNYRFISADIGDADQLLGAFDRTYDVIVHFAAETHVDRSIHNPMVFLETNILGTHNLLLAVLKGYAKKILYISTDEVYGSLGMKDVPFTEQSPLAANNPYSASKAGGDLLARSFYKTYQAPVIITRCSNNYGPRQDKEKLIPKIIANALTNKKIPLYGDGLQIRDWLYVTDHCRALTTIMEHGEIGEIYNIGGGNERTNLEITKQILNILGKDHDLINHVEDRKGHDRRYAINWGKIHKQLGWRPMVAFEDGLAETVQWYKSRLAQGGH